MPNNVVLIQRKTKNGQIQETAYETVAERVRKFRADCPVKDGWALITEVQFPDEQRVVAIAKIIDPEGRLVATGTAEELRGASMINRTSAVENAETSAIGRCLAAAGYGFGEFCSADELAMALQKQEELQKALEETKGTPKTSKSGKKAKSDNSITIDDVKTTLSEMGLEFTETENGIETADEKTFKAENATEIRGQLKALGFKWNGSKKKWTWKA